MKESKYVYDTTKGMMYVRLLSYLQSNINGSNIFGTMEICSRHG